MPTFCRHNRLTAKCPICSREMEADLRAKAPPRTRPARSSTGGAARRPGAPRGARSGGVVTRRLARAADDGYRNPLVPGLRATADAERLAAALDAAARRLAPPGPYPEVATEPDVEEAAWLAFLLALAGPDAPALQEAVLEARPGWATGELPDLPPERARAAAAYRAWAQRAGSQATALTGEDAWSPRRRFARVFERLALPGFHRAARFEFLAVLGAAEVLPLEADSLFLAAGDDATTDAAKRLLVSGDRLLLERRARDLAEACELPLAALDRGLAVWGTPGDAVDLAEEPAGAIRAALDLR
jgi:Alpha-glutamyl/putrescinyl thymine pyrophosphorylase clade 3